MRRWALLTAPTYSPPSRFLFSTDIREDPFDLQPRLIHSSARFPVSPNTNCPLPIKCPKCHHEGCTLVVKSLSVMTCTCAKCQHMWATELASLSDDIQQRVRDVVNNL